MATLADTSRFWTTRRTLRGGAERYIEWNAPRYGEIEEGLLVISDRHINRPDRISQQVYGRDDLWWVLLHYNNVADPFSLQVGDRLRVPRLSVVLDILNSMRSAGAKPIPAINTLRGVAFAKSGEQITSLRGRSGAPAQTVQDDLDEIDPYAPVYSFKQSVILPFSRLRKRIENAGLPEGSGAALVRLPGNVNLPVVVPSGYNSYLHFELQLSLVKDFSVVTMSRITYATQDGWFFYDPYANEQLGGFRAFPAAGLNAILFANQTVYYHPALTDPLMIGNQYYMRSRVWAVQEPKSWFATVLVNITKDGAIVVEQPSIGPVPIIQPNETPSGTVNGVNTTFTTDDAVLGDSLWVFLNGDQLHLNDDYTITSPTTFNLLLAPQPGDSIVVSYVKA